MSLIEICAVVITIEVTVIVVGSLRVMGRLQSAIENASRSMNLLEGLLADTALTATEIRELVISLQGIIHEVGSMTSRVTTVGNRAGDLASALVDEVETPVLRLAALARGLRVGVTHLVDKWAHRLNQPAPQGEISHG